MSDKQARQHALSEWLLEFSVLLGSVSSARSADME